MIGRNDIHTAARMFEPARLTLARELRGLTKQELAERVEKTPSAISQFESGRSRPDGQTIGRFMLALGFPASFFAKPIEGPTAPVIPLEVCHFRSLRSASQRSRRMLLARGSLLCALLTFLEHKVNLPDERVTAASATPKDVDALELLAMNVRRTWGLGLGPIGNMINLLERNGIVVVTIDDGCREVDAFSLWNGKRPCVFLVMEKGSTSRTRMDAAHELGHLVMHADVAAGSPELEQQANRFGSAFLMPRDAFYHEAPRRLNWDHIWELKRRWKVSAAAIVRRSYDLDLLSEATYRRAFVHLNQAGLRAQEPDEPPAEFPVAVERSMKVIESNWPIERIAEALGLYPADLHALVGFTHPHPLASPEVSAPRFDDVDGPLFATNRPPQEAD